LNPKDLRTADLVILLGSEDVKIADLVTRLEWMAVQGKERGR